MVQLQHWLLPREAYFSHMFLTFIPSNGPICLSKCVCCVLFPARFVPMLSLQWAPFSPGVWTEASRYLYRLNSWGPPSQSSVGWGEKLSWKRFRFNQALDNSLCFVLLIYFFSFSPLSSSCVSSMATSGRVHFGSALYISYVMSLLLFLFTLQLMVPAYFPLWNALLNKELARLDR